MEFLVERTSSRSKGKPVEEAYKKTYSYIDVRTFSSFEEYDKKLGHHNGNFKDKGVNHKVNERGNIEREFMGTEDGWFIKINTLEELMKFKEKYGEELVITTATFNYKIPCIEIYDFYRE